MSNISKTSITSKNSITSKASKALNASSDERKKFRDNKILKRFIRDQKKTNYINLFDLNDQCDSDYDYENVFGINIYAIDTNPYDISLKNLSKKDKNTMVNFYYAHIYSVYNYSYEPIDKNTTIKRFKSDEELLIMFIRSCYINDSAKSYFLLKELLIHLDDGYDIIKSLRDKLLSVENVDYFSIPVCIESQNEYIPQIFDSFYSFREDFKIYNTPYFRAYTHYKLNKYFMQNNDIDIDSDSDIDVYSDSDSDSDPINIDSDYKQVLLEKLQLLTIELSIYKKKLQKYILKAVYTNDVYKNKNIIDKTNMINILTNVIEVIKSI